MQYNNVKFEVVTAVCCDRVSSGVLFICFEGSWIA
jgi:hypothetical protein